MKLNNYQISYAKKKQGVFASMIGKLSLTAVMLLLSQVLSGKDINIDLSANNIFDGKRVVNYGIVPALKNDKGLTVIAKLQSSPYKKGTYAGAVTKLGKDGKIEFALNQAGWNNRFGFYVKNSQRDAFIHISPSLLFGKEHLVVGVFSPNMIAVYVDGKKVSSAKRNNNRLISTAGPLLIGALETDKNFFKGKISQVKIINRALTEKEIKKLSNTIKKHSIMEVVSPPELEFNRSLRFASPSFKDYQTNMQIVDYRVAPEATIDEIKTIINQVKKKGFDTFFLSGSFRYMFARKYGPRNWWNATPWPIYLKTAKKISKACHDAGLKFVVHLTVNLILSPDLPRFKDMGTRDITTKKEVEWPNYYGRCMCVNNPDFKAKLHARLHELVSKTNLDGLMIDEIAFSPSEKSCGCEHCAAGFKKAYGYDIPLPKDKSVWNNYDSSIWRAWLTFRRDSISRHAKDIKNILDSYGPDKILTGCSYNPAEAHIVRMCGYDTFALPYTVHFFENEPFHPWSWRHGIAECKYIAADGKPVIIASYSQSVSQAYFQKTLSLAVNCGNQQWVEFNKFRMVSVNWQKRWKPLWFGVKSIADTAIIISPDDNLLTAYNHRIKNNPSDVPREYFGWAEALTENHVMFDVLTTRRMENLERYRRLILPNTMVLSDKEVSLLDEFVRKGGHLIISGQSGFLNPDGSKRTKPALSKLAGIKFSGKVEKKKISGTNKVINLIKFELTGAKRLNLKKAFGKLNAASIKSYSSGGTVSYLGFYPGESYYMPKVGAGWAGAGAIWEDDRHPEAGALIKKLSSSNVLLTNNIPDEVIVNANKTKYDKYEGIAIHLFNALGTRFKKTVVIPTEKNYEFINYPSPNSLLKAGQSMQITIPGIKVDNGYMLSADCEKIVRLKVKNERDNACTITIPDIGRYAVIYLPLKNDMIRDLSREIKIVDKMEKILPFHLKYIAIR